MYTFLLLSTLVAVALSAPAAPIPKRPQVPNAAAAPVPKKLVIPNAVPISLEGAASAQVATRVAAPVLPPGFEQRQAESAKYEFNSDVVDNISDLTQQRNEVRNGLSVMGSYSYSDGYYKRTVNYVADENGYRVISQDAVPLGGPQVDLNGTAEVSSAAHGTHVSYKVQSVPVEGPVPKIIDQA